ncbi:phage tail tube protein [Methylogaea oryzae]|nr:phage tail tube protein [Methylogaea oryzae]
MLFEADNGKRWMLVNAFTKTAKLNVADGAYDVEMSCEIVEEM